MTTVATLAAALHTLFTATAEQLGRATGLALPTLCALVERGRAARGGERWQHPRTLEALGLKGLGAQGIRTVVEQGLAPVAPVSRVSSRFASGVELVSQV